jgi:hypothetical protein
MTQLIKAFLNFRKIAPEILVSISGDICAKMTNNSNFVLPQAPAPPVDLSMLSAASAALAAAISAALDGGKIALAQKKHAKDTVVKLLVQLAHYGEANCHGDMTVFLSSGFTPISSSRTSAPPVSEAIRKIVQGPNSGQVQITPLRDPEAFCYEVRWAPAGTDAGTGSWKSQPIPTIRPATVISGLTPATAYVFQVRAVTKAGYTDWSDPVTRVAT